MKFVFYKTSNQDDKKVIDIETLSELLSMVDDIGEIIIGEYDKYDMINDSNKPHYFIEDYDYYRE